MTDNYPFMYIETNIIVCIYLLIVFCKNKSSYSLHISAKNNKLHTTHDDSTIEKDSYYSYFWSSKAIYTVQLEIIFSSEWFDHKYSVPAQFSQDHYEVIYQSFVPKIFYKILQSCLEYKV